MNSNTSILRIFLGSIAIIIALIIFGLIVWRGSNILGYSPKLRTIIYVSISMIMVLAISLAMTSTNIKGFEILGAILLRSIYTIRVISPLVLVRDIISIIYKIPAIWMIIISIGRVGFGIYKGTTIKTTPLTISSNKIKRNYKIVFISDIHVEVFHQAGYIQSIVNKIKKINPDMVVLGGDLMNIANPKYVGAFSPFNQLNIPVYATVGNHDHMGDSTAIDKIFEKTAIVPIRNQSIEIDGIQIVGIDDKSYWGDKKLPEILQESKIADNGMFTILISHQPQKLEKLEGFPIDIELAGHTHNGQFIPINRIIHLFNDYTYGKYQSNGKIVFVSQGIGSWGAPIRIGTQSELVLISLHPEMEKKRAK